jgi:uncharacterized protein
MTKRTILGIVVTTIFYLCFCAGSGVLIAEGALHPTRRVLTPDGITREKLQARDDDASMTDVSATAKDGIFLRAWYLQPEDANGNAVLLLHGLGDNRLGMTDYADLFLHHGYSVLMPDARAHGMSGGSIATYGLLEADDIRRWFEWLSTNQHARCIYGFGESMGAAQILESLKDEPYFCAVAAESPFSTFRAYERVGQHFGTGPWLGRTNDSPPARGKRIYLCPMEIWFGHASPFS